MDDWSKDMEIVLNNIRINSHLLSEYHKTRYFFYKARLKYFRIPTIVLSGCNSVISVGLSQFVRQRIVSVITCLISLVCGIITSLEFYLGIQNNMENELIVSKDFYILSIDIFKMLSLERGNRMISGKTFVAEKFSAYCDLIEHSNIIDRKICDQLTPVPVRSTFAAPLGYLFETPADKNSNTEYFHGLDIFLSSKENCVRPMSIDMIHEKKDEKKEEKKEEQTEI